jgi:hypothetical protein
MLKYGIPDLRPFPFRKDLRWLRHYGFNPLAPVSLHEGSMKLTLPSWLCTHLRYRRVTDTITDRLTAIGLELESVTDPKPRWRRSEWRRHVLEAVSTNADRLLRAA